MTRSVVLLVLAVVAAVVATLIGFTVFDWEYYGGWLGLAVALGLASRLP
jgi:hypothetical protein